MPGSESITIYGILQILAIAVFMIALQGQLQRRRASLAGTGWVAACAILAAGIGGRLHYALEAWISGRASLAELPSLFHPAASGSTFFGAMGGVAVALALLRRRLPGGSVARLLDDGVLPTALAIAIGRIGCTLHGCCLGSPTDLPWGLPPGLHGEAGAGNHHPVALLLGGWALACALAGHRLDRLWSERQGPRPGTRFLLFLILFGLGRSGIEHLRLQTGALIGGAGWAQIESLALALAGVGILLIHRSRRWEIRPARGERSIRREPGLEATVTICEATSVAR